LVNSNSSSSSINVTLHWVISADVPCQSFLHRAGKVFQTAAAGSQYPLRP